MRWLREAADESALDIAVGALPRVMTRAEHRSDLIRCLLVLLLAFVLIGLAGESDRQGASERRYQVARVQQAWALEVGE